jgi:nucleoside 2-deoxyribosyltransferase
MSSHFEWDVYAAGPFFTSAQKVVMNEALSVLRSAGLKVCDPREVGPVITDIPSEEKRPELFRQILSGNVNGIERSYAIIACIDDRDIGTAWELGYNYALTRATGKFRPRITFSAHGYGTNLMIAQSVNVHCKSLSELSSTIGAIGVYLKTRDEFFLRNYFHTHKDTLAPVTS